MDIGDLDLQGGETVLIRATLAADGRTVIMSPGVELPTGALDIVMDVPDVVNEDGEMNALLLFFATDGELWDFAEEVRDSSAVARTLAA